MLDPIRLVGDPVLKTPCAPVTDFNGDVVALANRLQTLCERASGIGLAASQIGVLRRVFVFDLDYRVRGLKGAIVNPRIVEQSGTVTYEEGCLSIPDFYYPIERARQITVEAQTVEGDDQVMTLDGIASRLFQHEIDHLDGVLFIDRIPDSERLSAMIEVEQLIRDARSVSSRLGPKRRLFRRTSASPL